MSFRRDPNKPQKTPKAPKPVARRAAAKKAAVRALERAQRIAARMGVKLSDWEDEFLGSVATRVKTFGRAFADPEKGDPRAPLSMMQAVKLKQITAKAKGETNGDKRRSAASSRKKSPRT